ncbi:MAG: diguanylate cyclase [Betaproteobacteria bacterium]|nr:diguanylate cyclase [Betaproteobacteria bacterium]
MQHPVRTQAMRLLLVEDSAVDIELLLHSLRSQGYQVAPQAVDTAMSMRAAILGQEWDLIICDQSMPNLSAAVALGIAKEFCPDVPFIVVSGEIDLIQAVALIKLGAQDYVQKSELIRLGPVIERELRDAKRIHRHKLTEDRLHESQELFRAIVENVGDLVAVLDNDGRRVYNSPSYRPLFRETDIQHGSNSFLEIHPDDRDRIKEIFRRTTATGVGECAEFRFVLKDGSIRHMESDGRAIRGADGKVSKVVIVSRDITELKRLEADLREMAATDILTGLPNRRHFLAQLEQELARVRRVEAHRASVLMLDADHFKQVSDTFGHASGDNVLRHIAALMQQELRKVDTVGRIGGEEFALILPGAPLPAAEVFAERLRKKVAGAPTVHENRSIPLTVSIGVTEMKASDACADDALVRADRALYHAKECGRNKVTVEA